ncbi:MAG: molybdenum cofactor biosynthesis protein MoaE [Actinomycetes bacterium]
MPPSSEPDRRGPSVPTGPALLPPVEADDWLGCTDAPLPVAAAGEWAVRQDCGAVVVFTGTARDHAEGREGVTLLAYEAYQEQVVPSFGRVVAELRDRWPSVGRTVVLHRTGEVALGEAAVVVAVSAPHRDDAFAAARFAIDSVKATAPIWKKERWSGGDDWGTGATTLAGPPVRSEGPPGATMEGS